MLALVGAVTGGLIVGFMTDGGGTATHRNPLGNAVRNIQAPRCSGAGGSTVLTGAPGAHTFSLYVTNATSGAKLATICLNGVEHGSSGFNDSKRKHRWPPPVSAQRINPFVTEYTSLDPKNSRLPLAVTEVGRAGADVQSVSALLSTGKKVQATVSHGWYLVWWPGKVGRTDKLVVKTNTKTYEIPDPNGRFPKAPFPRRPPRGAGTP